MLFTRVASFFFAALTFGLVVAAKPVEKRATDPTALIESLETTVNGLVTQIEGITIDTVSNEIAAQTLINQVIDAIVDTTAELEAGGSLLKRQSAGDLAGTLADIITVLTGALSTLEGLIPGLASSASGVDSPLVGLINALSSVTDLVSLLTGLLGGSTSLLSGLGLTGLLGILNL